MKKWFILLLPLLLAACCGNPGQQLQKGPAYKAGIQKEKLGRGLIAIHHGEGNVTLSWRYLESDPIDAAFDIYRKSGQGEEVKINETPIADATFFEDEGADVTVDNTYRVAMTGSSVTEPGATYSLTTARAQKPYLEIPIKSVDGFADGTYSPNDATVGDLDGDGEYEIVVKLETVTYDNSRSGICNEGCLLDAYKLDGTFMWRVDLGINIRQGAHYTQMSLYDFDGDGKAELAVKTSEGTTFGDGQTIGDTDGDGITDYRNLDPQARTYGMILKGPEFLSIIDGMTGKELARTNYIQREDTYDFGDDTGNRVDRFLAGAGYFDGKRPSILICRGYYSRSVLEAWDWRNGSLKLRWRFDTTEDDAYLQYEKQGNHNLRIGDVDGDGCDEVVYGACMIDHDGLPGYTTGLEHGDAMHMSDLWPWRKGLEVWQVHETNPSRAGSEMRDAATGELLWGFPSTTDVGRGMTADIDPRFPGWEAWSSGTDGTYTADGRIITDFKPSVNFAIWWDGDLNRELLDGGTPFRPAVEDESGAMPQMPRMGGNNRVMKITKWTGNNVEPIVLPDEAETAVNNGTKSNPALSADLFGDWREELMVRTADNKSLRIYTTDYPTPYRFHTLMSDIVYRMSVLCENICYNQPPEPGYYLGSDLGQFWTVTYSGGQQQAQRAQRQQGPQGQMPQMGQPGQMPPQGQMPQMGQPGQMPPQGQMPQGQPGQMPQGQQMPMQRAAQTSSVGLHSRNQGEAKIQNDIVVYSNIADKYTLDARYDYDSFEWTVNGKVLGHDRTLTLKQADYGYDKPIEIKIKTTLKGAIFEGEGKVTFSSEEGRRGFWSDRDAYRNERKDF